MTKFYCNGKQTVYVRFTHNPIRFEVYNEKGKIYYFRELGGKFNEVKFNICLKGHYTISEECESIEVGDLVIKKIKIDLPKPDRPGPKVPITFVNNNDLITTPARTFRKTGVIEKGKKFNTFPYPVRLFILCHEIGHFYYASEENADLFACKVFINNGYNKSTALYSLTKVLKCGGKNSQRVLNLFKHLIK